MSVSVPDHDLITLLLSFLLCFVIYSGTSTRSGEVILPFSFLPPFGMGVNSERR